MSRSRGRLVDLGLLFLTSVICLAILEFGAPRVFQASVGGSFSRSETQARLWAASSPDLDAAPMYETALTRDHVLHPYLGFVAFHDPSVSPGSPAYVNGFGFVGMDPIRKRDPSTLIVGIFGGSVANILYLGWRTAVVEALHRLYPDRRIDIVCTAVAGYKQPQQLMALSYVCALGGEFDIVLNVDGFNEITLPMQENISTGVNPFFPRSWKAYARKALDRRAIGTIGEIARIRDRRATMARIARKGHVPQSSFALALWSALDSRATRRIAELNGEILDILRDDRRIDFQTTGPEFGFAGLEQLDDTLVATWSQCSRQMAGLAQVNGFRYYHFLQPNQYDRGSKTLTEEELARAYLPDSPGAKAAQRAYPLLRAAGRRLAMDGVSFTDLSMLFREVTADIYADNCCHYNETGNRMLVTAMTDVITTDLTIHGLALGGR